RRGSVPAAVLGSAPLQGQSPFRGQSLGCALPELPSPAHFDPSRVGEVWRVPYEDRAREAPAWADEHGLGPAAEGAFRLCHLAGGTRGLADGGKYDLTSGRYHATLGGIGHALVPAVEEAFFFHSVARSSNPECQVKGDNPLTEHYSMFGPEVTEGPDGDRLG